MKLEAIGLNSKCDDDNGSDNNDDDHHHHNNHDDYTSDSVDDDDTRLRLSCHVIPWQVSHERNCVGSI